MFLFYMIQGIHDICKIRPFINFGAATRKSGEQNYSTIRRSPL